MDINDVCKIPGCKASEIFESMESEAAEFAELLTKVGGGKPFYEVWNSEMDGYAESHPAIYALTANGKSFSFGGSQYIGGSYGDGWVMFNIGCPLSGGVDSLLVTDTSHVDLNEYK